MPTVERCVTVAEAGVSHRDPGVFGALSGEIALSAHRMTPGVRKVGHQAVTHLLLQLDLEGVVVVVSIRVEIVHRVCKRVRLEDVHRVTRLRIPQRRAGREVGAYQTAIQGWTRRASQRPGHRSRLAGVEVLDIARVSETSRRGQRRLRAVSAEGGLENG